MICKGENTRLDQIRNLTNNESTEIHILCPIRWRLCGDALARFIANCTKLIDLWDCLFKLPVKQNSSNRVLRLSCHLFVQGTLPDFYHSQSSNDIVYHDHPKKIDR